MITKLILTAGIIAGILICLLLGCDTNKPTADFTLKDRYNKEIEGGASLVCCIQYIIDCSKSKDVFRAKIEYLCFNDSLAIKTGFPIDSVMWPDPKDVWIKLTVWDDNGNKDELTKHYKVR